MSAKLQLCLPKSKPDLAASPIWQQAGVGAGQGQGDTVGAPQGGLAAALSRQSYSSPSQCSWFPDQLGHAMLCLLPTSTTKVLVGRQVPSLA